MNKEHLQRIFEKYIDNFEKINNKENNETYKWEIAQKFQRFDVDAIDFSEMLSQMCKVSGNLMGDRCCSNSLSNLGYVSLPDILEKHIDRLNFMLGIPRAKPGSATCVGYGNNLYITLSRKIKETDTEKYFFQKLVQLNIPIEIESNHRS